MNTYGAIKSPKDLRDYRLNRKTVKAISLPESYSAGSTVVKNQGSVGSCVAHTISEILESFDEVCYSTAWIYGYRPNGYVQSIGMIPSQALKTVTKVGYLTDKECPGNVEMNNAKKMIDLKLDTYTTQAAARKVAKYARLMNVTEIKESIYMNDAPVMLVIPVGDSGLNLGKNYVAELPNSIKQGYLHAVMCYGWNEQGLLIQNSWGTNWGKKGTFVLPYDYSIEEAWMISLDKDNIKTPCMYGVRNLLQKLTDKLK